MNHFFTIEDATTEPDGLLRYPPQFKIVRRQIARSFGLFSWREMAARLVRLGAKRHAKRIRRSKHRFSGRHNIALPAGAQGKKDHSALVVSSDNSSTE